MTLIDPAGVDGFDGSRVLFVGLGESAVAWYRCFLPALYLGCDWVGLTGLPPHVQFRTGLARQLTQMPDFARYDLVVLQQPRGDGWLQVISELRARGTRVLFEIDDYVHAIRKMPGHDFHAHFDLAALRSLERNMRVCDGVIASTGYIARRYRAFNARTWTCENGLDLGRYRLTRPPSRPGVVTVGWAGGTGHRGFVEPWLVTLAEVMRERPAVRFISIGQSFADELAPFFGAARAFSIPWAMIDTYPSAMRNLDVVLAPAGKGNFFRGKSSLRFLEAGALGIPTIADPVVYPEIEHGVTGFHASTPGDAGRLLRLLVGDERLRLEVGENARRWVLARRDMRVMSAQWAAVFREVLAGDEPRQARGR